MAGAYSPDDLNLSAEAMAFAKRLGSRKAEVRQKAEQEILSLEAEGRAILVSIMRSEGAFCFIRRQHVYLLCAMSAILGVLGLTMIVLSSSWDIVRRLSIITEFDCLLIALAVWTAYRNDAHAAGLLATHFDDVTLIGPMAEALEYKRKAVRATAANTLIRLLPRLREDEAHILTALGRSNLHQALLGSNPGLALAAVQALGKVGDSKAIPNIRKLASGLGLARNDHKIREAAEQSLLQLNQRLEAQQALNTLLRPAVAGEAHVETLVRPATRGNLTDTEQLLRAGAVSDSAPKSILLPMTVTPAEEPDVLLESVSQSTGETR